MRGARRVGKTALLRRLQGLPHAAEYVPTPEIQTATFNWTYKSSDDKIEVEVWDVVDRAIVVGQAVADDDDAPAGACGRGCESRGAGAPMRVVGGEEC